jgi:predicted ATPase with chaperone activity
LQIQRYVGRISGPLLDRIDIHVDVPAVKFRELAGEPAPEAESSAEIRDRVISARERQCKRLAGEKIFSNAAMTPRMIRRHCRIDSESEQMLERAMTRLGLSARAILQQWTGATFGFGLTKFIQALVNVTLHRKKQQVSSMQQGWEVLP